MKKLIIASLLSATLTGCFNTYHLDNASMPVNEVEVVTQSAMTTTTYKPESKPTPVEHLMDDFESNPIVSNPKPVEKEQVLDVESKQSIYSFSEKKQSVKVRNAANGLMNLKRASVTEWKGL